MRPGSASRGDSRQGGFTLVAVLALVFLFALGLSVAGPRWHDLHRRAQERELMRVGVIYAQALADFRDNSPGSLKEYPRTLEELTLDPRFLGVRRHLRQLYPDPLDPARPWGVVRDKDGGIVGVFSQSEDAPIALGPVDLGSVALVPARRYSDWKFTAPNQP